MIFPARHEKKLRNWKIKGLRVVWKTEVLRFVEKFEKGK
jgi:hypothetical protein